MKNRQHLQAAVARWLSSLRSLCHAHKVFDQKYLKKQHQQSWSVDPNSAICSPAVRSTVQRYLNAKVLFAWNKIKEVGVFKICSLKVKRLFCCEEQVLNLAFSLTKLGFLTGYLQLISKVLRGKSLDPSPAEVHGDLSIICIWLLIHRDFHGFYCRFCQSKDCRTSI